MASHVAKFGPYGCHDKTTTYTVMVEGVKITVEVVNRPASYVATALTGRRRIRSLVSHGINSEREKCENQDKRRRGPLLPGSG
ncbi:DUF4060 family protein [Kosakonia radicincitans]|uniref:DUF4060 family protein n=1 Tax=Kosakonia radicincitans TaxID=283686 RepID=UPI0036F3D4FE